MPFKDQVLPATGKMGTGGVEEEVWVLAGMFNFY